MIIILLFTQIFLFPQVNFQQYNLDFEIGSAGTLPVGWRVSKETTDYGYTANIYDLDSKSGLKSLAIFNFDKKDTVMSGAVYQGIDALPFRGKKVKLTANIKIFELGENSFPSIYLQDFLPGEKRNELTYSKIAHKDSLWIEHSVELIINKSAEKINIGALLTGTGNIIVDNFRLEIISSPPIDAIKSEIRNGNDLDNKLAIMHFFVKALVYMKNFYPDANAVFSNKDLFARNVLKEIDEKKFSTKNQVTEFIKTKLELLYPSMNNKIDESRDLYVWKHFGAPNYGSPNFSKTELKNIYQPDREKEGTAYQRINMSNYKGMDFKMSIFSKLNPYNSTGYNELRMKITPEIGNSYDLFTEKRIPTKDGWEEHIIEGKLPDNIKTATIGFSLIGEGEVNFDYLRLICYDSLKDENIMLIPNNSFEFMEGKEPKNWVIPSSSENSGYFYAIDSNNKSDGLYSLRISTNKSEAIQYPNIGNVYIIGDSRYGELTLPVVSNFDYEKDSFEDFNTLSLEDDYTRILIVSTLINELGFLDNYFRDESEFLYGAVSNKNYFDFKKMLYYIVSYGNDNYYNIWNQFYDEYCLPFLIDVYSDGIFVKGTYSQEKNILKGDKIIELDGKSISQIMKEGNYGKMHSDLDTYKSINEYILGPKDSPVKIKLLRKGDTIELTKTRYVKLEEISIETYPEILKFPDSIYYINLSKTNDNYFKGFMNEYADIASAFIFDARTTSGLSEHFLSYFTDSAYKGNTYQIPIYISPNHISQKVIKTQINSRNLKKIPQIFLLINEKTVGYTESIAHTLKNSGKGTIIGTPSAGSCGERGFIRLPAGFIYSKSIMKVFDKNDNEITFKSLKPDYIQPISSESLFNEYDEQIGKALQIIKNNRK